MAKSRSCKDCAAEGVTTERAAPFPGPRCATHNREWKKRNKHRAHARRMDAVYGITAADYQKLYHYQGGRCYICQRATGARKRLAVDHDHKLCGTHPPDQGCRRCIRGLLCSICNRVVIGRYGIDSLQRAIDYLHDPPARSVVRPR